MSDDYREKDEEFKFTHEDSQWNEENTTINGAFEDQEHEDQEFEDDVLEDDVLEDQERLNDAIEIDNLGSAQSNATSSNSKNFLVIVMVVSIFIALAGTYFYFTKPIRFFGSKNSLVQTVPPLNNTDTSDLKTATTNNPERLVETTVPKIFETHPSPQEEPDLTKPGSVDQVKEVSIDQVIEKPVDLVKGAPVDQIKKESIDRIFVQLEEILNTTNDLNAIKTNATDIAAINEKLEGLQKDVRVIVKKLDQLTHIPKKKSPAPKSQNNSADILSSYVLESITIDQAYVLNQKTNKRQMITVGDLLSGGIKVTKIDAAHFQVLTTVGQILF